MMLRLIRTSPLRALLVGAAVATTSLAVAANSDDNVVVVVKCPVGWSNPTVMQVIPADRINDGYCDCPTTGADEPDTAACAGAADWPGILMPVVAEGGDAVSDSTLFSCPQQPKLKLHPSKLNDGICDCCEGADETAASDASLLCPDKCDEMLAQERAERKKLQQSYAKGAEQRQKAVAAYAAMREKSLADIAKAEQQMTSLQDQTQNVSERIEKAKLEWIQQRLGVVQNRVASMTSSTDGALPLDALSEEELVWFMVHACQTAGEMNADSKYKTCLPLRLAGLDAALTWEPQTYDLSLINNDSTDEKELERLVLLADALKFNGENEDNKMWHLTPTASNNGSSRGARASRRRLQVDYEDIIDTEYRGTDDDYFYEEEEEYIAPGDDEDDEEYQEEQLRRLKRQRPPSRNRGRKATGAATSKDDDAASVSDDKRQEILDLIKGRAFSKTRVHYLDMAGALMETIESYESEQEGAEVELDEAPEPPDEEEEATDPMAFRMTKNELQRRQKAIERGLDYAVSARVLLDAALTGLHMLDDGDEARAVLHTLAVMTIGHANLSALQVWQVYASVMPTLTVADSQGSSETCQAPWASMCPPQKDGSLPSTRLLEVAKSYCDGRTASGILESVCAGPNIIPSSLPDGYFGYYEVQPRGEDDLMSSAFAGLELDAKSPEREELIKLEGEKNDLEDKISSLQSEIDDLEESIGGRDGPGKFGTDGELHAFKDKCHSVLAGKYTYELCLFGKSWQKEGKGSDTHLGTWSEATMEPAPHSESGELLRVWKWTHGTRCWNGPARSATAYVTCGVDTKVLSADEPDTCRYVFEVESYVACDDAFRISHGLT